MNTNIPSIDKEKYIGLVKWFHDQSRDSNYGFILHAKLGEIYFNERSIEQSQNLNSFRENEIVVFIPQASQRHEDKLEAIDVKLLSTETDLFFLFRHFLSILNEKGKYSDYNLIQKGVHSKITSLIENVSDKKIDAELFELYQNYLTTVLQIVDVTLEENLKGLLRICKSFFPNNQIRIADLIEKSISNELAHKLWLDRYIATCQVNLIANTILFETQQTKQKIFNKCSDEDKSNIFFKVLYTFEKIDSELKLQTTKDFLKLTKEFAPILYDKIINATLNICTDYFKLNLWLEDFSQTLDFNLFKLYTITLSPENQKKFVKKVLKYIHEEKTNISIEELTSLNLIDYETSKLVAEIDKTHLDYSTSIILNIISELKNQIKIDTREETNKVQYKIYDLILKQINEPKDILQITGYFDECGGRCTASVNEEKNEQGEIINRIITYNRNEHKKAKYHPFCDGRKAIDKTTEIPILTEDNNTEYWWCANQKCSKPSRELHVSTDWEKYTLLDFLTILKVQYREIDLEIYLNIINKANRFLQHLKCRKCNHILYPVGKTTYAFYGVNKFYCKTDGCCEKGNEIYLSHCLNGSCEMEIDSRDCIKCKPDGYEQDSCGWYICNNCHACCTDQKLNDRKYVYENILHTEYKCHLKGHRELGIICCNKCGDSMESNKMDIEDYNRILDWFISNREKSKRIYKSDKNKFGKWWFIIRRGNYSYEAFKEKLNKYYQMGFQIPNLDENRDLQLISEPIDFNKHRTDILICKSCGNILDLSMDLEKARAIRNFHNVSFVNEKAEI